MVHIILLCSLKVLYRAECPTSNRRTSKNGKLMLLRLNNNPIPLLLLAAPFSKEYFKYEMTKSNVLQVHSRCIGVGKVFFSFKQPSHNVCIHGEPVHVHKFMYQFHQILNHCSTPDEYTPIQLKEALKSVVKSKRSVVLNDNRSLPFSIDTLIVDGKNSGLTKIGFNIMRLEHLQHLDLEENKLSVIPIELGNKRLKSLNLSRNLLTEDWHTWKFLYREISQTLVDLNVSHNLLKKTPMSFCHLRALKSLIMTYNNIKVITPRVGLLPKLQELHISHNAVSSLPTTFVRTYADLQILAKIAIDNNKFTKSVSKCKTDKGEVPRLGNLAAFTIIMKRVPYSAETFPRSVLTQLESTGLCCPQSPCYINQRNTSDVSLTELAMEAYTTSFEPLPLECHPLAVT